MDNHEEEKEPLIAQSRAEGANLTDKLAALRRMAEECGGYVEHDRIYGTTVTISIFNLPKLRDKFIEAANA